MRISRWDKERAKKILSKRLQDCMKFRESYEYRWRRNELTLYNTGGVIDAASTNASSFDIQDIMSFVGQDDEGDMGINYVFKNFRFLHAQASANPPSCVARPTSTDPSDRKSAEAADNLIRHAIRAYHMQNKFDLVVEQGMLYGTSFMKTWWNPDDGDIESVEGDEIKMTGAINISPTSTWDLWFDPQALEWNSVRYVIERKWMSEEELYSKYPSKIVKLIMKQGNQAYDEQTVKRFAFRNKYKDLQEKSYPVYCYWERGMATNGMAGRYCEFMRDGTVIGSLHDNPFSFEHTTDGGESYEVAHLPFHILTDVDVSDQIYGKSFIEYAAMGQDLMNKIDSMQLENIQAHGIVRGVVPESSNLPDDAFTDSAFDLLPIAGVTSPHFMSPPSTMPATDTMRSTIRQGVDELAGVNESMFGQQSREQSGFSMQYATNQGNMIRRRFFNKYVECVESTYKGYLSLVRKYWDVAQMIQVLGSEKAFTTVAISSADIQGGFDLVVEFGTNLSLDPQARRDEIMQLMPIFEKAGVDTSVIMNMLRLNDVEGMYDFAKMGERRQSEIFQEMIENLTYIAPEEWEDHQNYLKYSYYFTQTREFRDLDPRAMALLLQHQTEREQLAASGPAGAAPAQPQAGGEMQPQPGAGQEMMSQPQAATQESLGMI